MEIYKKAIKENLRYQTSKGSLTTEQLYDLTLTDLANALKDVKKLLKKDDEDGLDFLTTTATSIDSTNQLRFDVLKDVYLTKKEEKEAERTRVENKKFNDAIIARMKRNEEKALDDLSNEELAKLLK